MKTQNKNNSQFSIFNSQLKYLLEKEFKQFFRNRFLPLMTVMLPFVALAVFPLVANMDVKNLKLAIIDSDHSNTSRQMTEKVASSGYFKMQGNFPDYQTALQSVEKGDVDLLLEIPANFENNLNRENSASVMISANAVNGMSGSMGSAYLQQIINQWTMDNGQLTMMKNSSQLATVNFQMSTINILPLYRYNPRLDFKRFMIPALIAMMLAMICGFLPALNIVAEKENGTIEQMNVTPVGKFTLILSKLIPYWVAGFIVVTLCILTAYIFYGMFPAGNVLLIYLFAIVFALCFSGFGLIVSNYASNIQQAIFIMFFFVISLIFLSGLYTPYQNMPQWLQIGGNVSPLKYFIQSLRMVYLKGATFGDMKHLFFPLCALAVIFNGWAVLSYRKTS